MGREPWDDYRADFRPEDAPRVLWAVDQMLMHLPTLEYAASVRKFARVIPIILAAGLAAGVGVAIYGIPGVTE